MFVGQRLPFLLRLQARIGVAEIMSDSLERLDESARLAGQAGPLARDLAMLTVQLNELVSQAGPLMAEFRRLFPRDPSSTLTEKLSIARGITTDLQNVAVELNRVPAGSAAKGMVLARSQVEGVVWNVALAVFSVGASLVALWWLGYYLVKRPYLQAAALLERKGPKRPKSGTSPPSSNAAA
jgi:hypothetical protein